MSFTKEQLREQMLLYAVTDRHWLNGQTLYEQVEEALKGGATFIQLREKDLTEEEFLEEAKKIQQLCKEYRVPFAMHVSGFKYREIAEKLNISVRPAEHHIYLTLLEMKKISFLFFFALFLK